MKERRRFAVILGLILVMGGVCFGISITIVPFTGAAIWWLVGSILSLVGFLPFVLRSAKIKAKVKYVDDSEK